MEGDDAMRRTPSAPSDLFSALSAIEVTLNQEIANDIASMCAAVFPQVACALGATHAAFWYIAPDGVWHLDAASGLPTNLQAHALDLAHQAIASMQMRTSTQRGRGTLVMIPATVAKTVRISALVAL